MLLGHKTEWELAGIERRSDDEAAKAEGEEREFATASAAIASRTFAGAAFVYARRAFYLSAINLVLLIILLLKP